MRPSCLQQYTLHRMPSVESAQIFKRGNCSHSQCLHHPRSTHVHCTRVALVQNNFCFGTTGTNMDFQLCPDRHLISVSVLSTSWLCGAVRVRNVDIGLFLCRSAQCITVKALFHLALDTAIKFHCIISQRLKCFRTR